MIYAEYFVQLVACPTCSAASSSTGDPSYLRLLWQVHSPHPNVFVTASPVAAKPAGQTNIILALSYLPYAVNTMTHWATQYSCPLKPLAASPMH